jgi:hypothetical protein
MRLAEHKFDHRTIFIKINKMKTLIFSPAAVMGRDLVPAKPTAYGCATLTGSAVPGVFIGKSQNESKRFGVGVAIGVGF